MYIKPAAATFIYMISLFIYLHIFVCLIFGRKIIFDKVGRGGAIIRGMEKLPHQEYRDELAKKLKEIRNSEPENPEIARAKAQGYLEARKETGKYKKTQKSYKLHKADTLNQAEFLVAVKEYEHRQESKLQELNSKLDELKINPVIGFIFKDASIEAENWESRWGEPDEALKENTEEIKKSPLYFKFFSGSKILERMVENETFAKDSIDLLVKNQHLIPDIFFDNCNIIGSEFFDNDLVRIKLFGTRGSEPYTIQVFGIERYCQPDKPTERGGWRGYSELFHNHSASLVSSIRFKEELQPIENVVEKVGKLRGVSFKWKSDGTSPREIGVIAEEVADVFPELVFLDREGKPLGVHYDKFIAVLIEAVKELKGEIEELKKK